LVFENATIDDSENDHRISYRIDINEPIMKSPLKAKPLRNPGESTDDRIWDFILDEILKYILFASLFCFMAILEWLRWYTDSPPNPIMTSIIAIIAIALAVFKLRRARRTLKQLKLGRDGEKAVGQYLERLRSNGAQVLHDFPGEGFNVDHVVIHKSGIYAIETKTFSKPDKGEPRILFDGETLMAFGRSFDRNPVSQARAASQWLREKIYDSTGLKHSVRPVVLFPGWYIEQTAEAKSSDVWVLNPKALPSFIENSRQQIKEAEVNMIHFHLSTYARNILSMQ
jgi:hypothetical protein